MQRNFPVLVLRCLYSVALRCSLLAHRLLTNVHLTYLIISTYDSRELWYVALTSNVNFSLM